MAVDAVRRYFSQWNLESKILEFSVSSATVELAAKALGCAGARIAKTLSFKVQDATILIVCAGDVKIDNAKYKAVFGTKAKMLTAEEVLAATGHAVGGVCPFAVPLNVPVYLDVSLKRFTTVYPACGSANSAIELTPDDLFTYAKAREFIDVCKLPEEVSTQ